MLVADALLGYNFFGLQAVAVCLPVELKGLPDAVLVDDVFDSTNGHGCQEFIALALDFHLIQHPSVSVTICDCLNCRRIGPTIAL